MNIPDEELARNQEAEADAMLDESRWIDADEWLRLNAPKPLFTWDDVDRLRWHADQIFGENQLPANQLKELADRIEALLPPRAK